MPSTFPVRKVGDGGWEVLIADENMWLSCASETDARIIARARILEYESLEGTRSGDAFAAELDELASTLEKYRMGFGSRYFRRRATEVRRAADEDA
jgi:hypothetical protein